MPLRGGSCPAGAVLPNLLTLAFFNEGCFYSATYDRWLVRLKYRL